MNPRTTLADTRKQTDVLFDRVAAGALYERPIPERHRLIFYLGHLEAFDWNLLRPHLRQPETWNEQFDRLFAFGIDPVGGGLPSEPASAWPAEDEIRRYNQRVRQTLDDSDHDPLLLGMALEHRLMHAETLAYMLHQLPPDRKQAQPQAAVPESPAARGEAIEIPAGCATLGLARHGAFGWDNEFDAHQVGVPAFAIGRYKVTNHEYLQFMEAGGYRDPAFWTPAAWQWKARHNISHPVFWEPVGHEWRYRTMFDRIELPPDWPVYVSHSEASAYAAWVGGRLPTEAEWHRAAYGTPDGAERPFPWGDEPPGPRHGYFDFQRWDPAPVHAFPGGRSAFGLDGLLANGWEWTSSLFAPFRGFQAHPSYAGYSADFFDGRHYVLKGGSARTAACMLRRSFRNWFQPHYQYVYAGFRCAKGVRPMATRALAPDEVSAFAADIRNGLTKSGQKELASKFLYDELGSKLFDAISLLPEYGLTRADERLLRCHAGEIVERLPGDTVVAELGSGSGSKTRWILEAFCRRRPTSYFPIEISAGALYACRRELADIDSISIVGFEREYLDGLLEVAARRRAGQRILVLFLGSTIGNFDHPADVAFLREIRAILETGDALLLGTDLEKPVDRLLEAYDDSLGVTAAFNLNLLARINRQLDADFSLAGFEHLARFNPVTGSIEMHLRSKCRQRVTVAKAGFSVEFGENETIWTETSHKYSLAEVEALTWKSGFRGEVQWVDAEWPFAESLLIAV
jgi:dimethylhistidine N-methyltransferase